MTESLGIKKLAQTAKGCIAKRAVIAIVIGSHDHCTMSGQLYCEVCHKLRYPRFPNQEKCECKDAE